MDKKPAPVNNIFVKQEIIGKYYIYYIYAIFNSIKY